MAVGFPLQNQVAMMNMMMAGQGNGAMALQSAGLQQAQCSLCQLDPGTGQHICGCVVMAPYISHGYYSVQEMQQQVAYCDCPVCPYAGYAGGAGGLVSGSLPIGGALPPLAAGFGMGGAMPMNALGMAGGLPINALALQGLSPLSGAGFGGAAGLGGAAGFGGMAALGGMQVYKSLNPSFNSPSDSSSRGGMMAGGIGANNSSRMLSLQMGGGLNRRGFGSRGNVGMLGYPPRGRGGYGRGFVSSPWGNAYGT